MTEFTPEELAENRQQIRKLTARLSGSSQTAQDDVHQARLLLREAPNGTCADCREQNQTRVKYGDLLLCGACAESRLKVCLKVGVVPNVR